MRLVSVRSDQDYAFTFAIWRFKVRMLRKIVAPQLAEMPALDCAFRDVEFEARRMRVT